MHRMQRLQRLMEALIIQGFLKMTRHFPDT